MRTLLGYYAAYTGNALPTFRDNLPGLSQSGKKIQANARLDLLTLEDGTDMLSRIFGNALPPYAAQFPTGAQISSTSRRKPDIKHLFVRQNLSSSFLYAQTRREYHFYILDMYHSLYSQMLFSP
jgi:hypothetical protein